jgi:hypothetical protein
MLFGTEDVEIVFPVFQFMKAGSSGISLISACNIILLKNATGYLFCANEEKGKFWEMENEKYTVLRGQYILCRSH